MIGIQESLAAFTDQQQICQETESEALECGTDHSYIIVVTSDVEMKPQNAAKADRIRSRNYQKTEKIKSDLFRCDLCGFCSGSKAYFSRHMVRVNIILQTKLLR